jgi:hypothetical protein
LVTALLAVVVAAGCSGSHRPTARVAAPEVPWNGAIPAQLAGASDSSAAACRAGGLRVVGAGFVFSSALTGGTGTVTLRNESHRSCRLAGRPEVRLVGAPREPAQRQLPLPAAAVEFPDVVPPPSTLDSLAPHAAVTLGITWTNWCPPRSAGARKPLVPPRSVRISLPGNRGSIDISYNAVPSCDHPERPSTIGVRPFAPAPLPSGPPWTSVDVAATMRPIGDSARITAARGQLARYAVVLTNRSATTVRFDRCPLLIEALEPAGRPEAHELNCAGAHPIAPRRSLSFEMRIRVPGDAPLGTNGLFWELDPLGAQAPEVVSKLRVTRR